MKTKRRIYAAIAMLMLFLCCSMLFVACDNTDSHVHYYKETVVAPTCTEGGYTLYQCDCGDNYITDKADAPGHSYGELFAEKDATYTENGHNAYYRCEVCGIYFDAEKNETTWAELVIGALGHDYGDLVVAKPATCIDSGNHAYYHCEECDTYFDEVKEATTWAELVIGALGHDYGDLVVAKPATCTDSGNHAYYHCEECDTYFDAEKNETTWAELVIGALGHDYGNLIVAKPVTCTSDGYNAYFKCKSCGAYFDEAENETTWSKIEIKSNGHDYIDNVVPPTCSAGGYTEHVCACGDSYTDTGTNKIDHIYNAENICTMCQQPRFLLKYTLSDDESYYIVSGIESGACAEFEIPSEYLGKPVKEIGASAFEGNTAITRITIPESVEIIGDSAFKGCTNLTVNIGAQLTSIGTYAFSGTAITSVTIPDGIKKISKGVFCDCTKLADVVFPKDWITEIGSYAFKNTAIKELPRFPNLSKIGAYAFKRLQPT